MATTVGDRVFVDTNILVYATIPASPFHVTAIAKLDEMAASGELWASRQVLREFLASMSRPGTVTPPLPKDEILLATSTYEQKLRIAEDGPDVFAQLLTLLDAVPCGGRQVYDANIAATMIVHGIPAILTHNVADFARFASWITVIPLIP